MARISLSSADRNTPLRVREFARHGVDAAIITAASPSAEPVELAAEISRERGRIVVVGTVDLGVFRKPMYMKELSLVLSRSYGPGRYDPQYEEDGVDYPVGYVRWTEKRNMEAFLALLASGAVNVTPLIAKRCPVEQGGEAYQELKETGAYTVLLEYPSRTLLPMPEPVNKDDEKSSRAAQPRASRAATLRVGCIGAGGFARDTIFPALRRNRAVVLHSVATASGVASESARRLFHFDRAVPPAELIQDKDTDAVFVLSRHDSHAQYVIAALSNQKQVFVEKPLAITREQLEEVRSAYQEEEVKNHNPFLVVGFNRRFAPFTQKLKQFFTGRQESMIVNIRVNAGYIPSDHWVQRSEGGRVVGELCHVIDWARCVVGVCVTSVTGHALPDGSRYSRDNIVATLAFQDGSIANLVYVANGDRSIAKEQFEVFCEGKVGRIEDFRVLQLAGAGKTKRFKARRDKGHAREIELTLEAMRSGVPSPIPFAELIEVFEATIAVQEAIAGGRSISLGITDSRTGEV